MNSEKSKIEKDTIESSGGESSGIFNYLKQDKKRSSRVPHALAIAASTVIVLAGIQAASVLVGPILLALFLAVILLVPLRWLQQHGCPHLIAFLVVLICTIALFLGITYFVSKSLTEFIGKIPAYKNRVVAQYEDVKVQLEKWGFGLGKMEEKNPPAPIVEPEQPVSEPLKPPVQENPVIHKPPPRVIAVPISETTNEGLAANDTESSESEEEITEKGEEHLLPVEDVPALPPEKVIDWVNEMEKKEQSLIALEPSVLAYWLARVLLYARSMLEGAFLVLIFTIFMLFEASHFPAKVTHAFGNDGPINIKHFHRIAEDIRRYLFLKTIANLMSGSAAMFVYWLFGVDGWLLWGIIAFLMYYIPNIGGTLAAVIPGALILASPFGIPGVLLYAVCLLTIECTIAYGIEPRILGHGLRLSTLVIILSLFFWGFLLGPIGLFLAAPLTVMIKIILQAFPETRWIAVFLEGSGDKH